MTKGPRLILGRSTLFSYYKRDDLNKESFVDGWFKTGDVGQFAADGTLSLIDRIKNLVKLNTGGFGGPLH
jgi:long-chain acyl-CoA synthetase